MARDASQPNAQTQAIADAIEHLYDIFGKYRFTDKHGTHDYDPAPLLAAPLKVLPPSAFDVFAGKCLSTWGTADDLRHFLPRMLELSCTLHHNLPPGAAMLEAEFLFSKLTYGKWRTWPDPEIAAIEGFIQAWWRQIIFSESGLDTLKKYDPGSRFAGSGGWNLDIFSDEARDFLCDMDFLNAPSFEDALLETWAIAIDDRTRLGPVANLAKVYIKETDWGLNQLDDWFKRTARSEALYAAWLKYQDNERLGAFFSDAHAKAEMICSD